jgi:AhpD family alkylhydroperoxidase
MTDSVYSAASRELAEQRKKLAPATHDAFQAFSKQVFADGALPGKTKQLIAVAVAHTTQCPYCIRGHTKTALRAGAINEEIILSMLVTPAAREGASECWRLDDLGSILEPPQCCAREA